MKFCTRPAVFPILLAMLFLVAQPLNKGMYGLQFDEFGIVERFMPGESGLVKVAEYSASLQDGEEYKSVPIKVYQSGVKMVIISVEGECASSNGFVPFWALTVTGMAFGKSGWNLTSALNGTTRDVIPSKARLGIRNVMSPSILMNPDIVSGAMCLVELASLKPILHVTSVM